MVLQTVSYTLRASAPQPIKGTCSTNIDPNPPTTGFVLQTFKAEKRITESCDDKERLLCSNDMLGLGGEFISASYTAQRFPNPDTGQLVFQSQEVKKPTIVDESEVPGVSNL